MAKSLSLDLRRRVMDAIEQGLSCRQADDREAKGRSGRTSHGGR
jgi:transposase